MGGKDPVLVGRNRRPRQRPGLPHVDGAVRTGVTGETGLHPTRMRKMSLFGDESA